MKAGVKCATISILWGLYSGVGLLENEFLQQSSGVEGYKIIQMLNFGVDVSFQPVALIMLILNMFPIFVFQFVYGTYIYRHFCTASVYWFSRCPHRSRWFIKESFFLWGLSCIYAMCFYGTGCSISFWGWKTKWTGWTVLFFLYSVTILALWLFITTMLINVLSLYKGSMFGFGCVAAWQLACTGILQLWNNILSFENGIDILKKGILLKINPISHVVLCWHSSKILIFDEQLCGLPITFPLSESVVYMLIMAILSWCTGVFVIRRKEILVENMEWEG